MMGRPISIAAVILFVLGMSLVAPEPVQAESPATWAGDIDGVPVWITVVPRGHTITAETRQQEPWWEWGNTTTDAYIFAFNSPDDVRLILDFSTTPDGLPEARLHMEERGRWPLDYLLRGDELIVRSNSGYPYVTVRPESGGWIVDGKANYDLRLYVDGPMPDFGPIELVRTDGQIDTEIRVGTDTPGRPDWQTQRLVNDPEPTWGYRRFVVRQRMPDAPAFDVFDPLMPGFPYLGMGAANIFWYDINPNPLYFHVDKMELQLYAFPSFHIGGTFEVISLGLPPSTNFETPFAFYNFDPTTRYAQLVVRPESFPAYHHLGPQPNTYQRTTFRYSWKTSEETDWAYSFHVAGTHAYDDWIEVGDERFPGVSSDEYPRWVVSKEWPVVTFVEAVNGYIGSEGIYFYSAQANAVWPWISGKDVEPPVFLDAPYLPDDDEVGRTVYESLPVGFRGEYNAAYFRQPRTYWSPVDERLHMLHAQGGLWNLGDGYVLRTHNLTRDAYIDGWTRERAFDPLADVDSSEDPAAPRAWPGTAEESLYHLAGFLIYSGPEGAELRRTAVRNHRFEADPPTNRDTWEHLRDAVAPFEELDRDPFDLRSWLERFRGERVALSGSAISDVRPLNGGFRFQLEVGPRATIEGPELLGVRSLPRGSYAVTYDGADFSVEELIPAEISLDVVMPPMARQQLSAIEVVVQNRGLEDVPAGVLELSATGPDGQSTSLGEHRIAVMADTSEVLRMDWAPLSEGVWYVEAQLRAADGGLVAAEKVPVAVSPPPIERATDPFRITGAVERLGLIGSWLVLIVLGAAVLLRRTVQGLPR